ncbi:MAG: CbiX/SirB N-terminal domain-containing protein [Verrucomicrobiota bacterium]
MGQDDFSDAALVLIGHGSTLNAESGAPVFQHAAALRRRNHFAEVREAFWRQAPRLAEALAGIAAPRVFLVPLFISEGYFSEQVIPRALGLCGEESGGFDRLQRRGTQTIFYCKPVGTHESMTAVLLARAREIVEEFPFPRAPGLREISLFIAGHGTEQDGNSRAPIENQAREMRGLNLYADTQAVFLEEAPRIGDCYQLAQTRNIVVVPFFISNGLHVRHDIPLMLGQSERVVQQRLQSGQPAWRNPTELKRKLVWYAPSVGSDARIADVILERVREASRWSRESPSRA